MAAPGVRAVARGAAVALAALLGGLAVMAAFADRLIFVPPPPSYGADERGLVRLPAASGDTVAALVRPLEGASLAVLFAHGNAEDAGHSAAFLDRYRALGVTVAAVDYPGYGLSTGTPSESGAYAAADAALAHLGALGYPPGRVVLHGRSLGGAVAAELAARTAVAGVVLESTFTSAFRVMLPVDGIPGDRFTTLARLPRITAPVLVIHGTRDEVVAFSHGERLAAALPPERTTSWWVEGAGHNDLLLVAGEAYWEQLARFLGSLADPGSPEPENPHG